MRITHPMMTRNYLKRMNTNLSNLAKSNERMSSQRAYQKGYEDVSSAGKALKIRKLIADNERYQENIQDLQGRITAAEDGLRTVTALMTRVEDRVVEGLNGTMSPEDRQLIATELEKYQEEVFQIMNNSYAGKHLYNSAGNKDGTAPFTKNAVGDLMYNGTYVNQIQAHPTKNTPAVMENGVLVDLPYNDKNYVDIGFNFAMNAGGVDANTAFLDSYSGIELFGYGTNAEGVPLNAYSLLGSMVDNLRNNNMDGLGKNLDAISESMSYMLSSITEIGARSVLLADTASRLESEYIVLAETQGKLEGIDLSKEAIFNKDYEMSWMVTLQLGSRILPQTIFEFIR